MSVRPPSKTAVDDLRYADDCDCTTKTGLMGRDGSKLWMGCHSYNRKCYVQVLEDDANRGAAHHCLYVQLDTVTARREHERRIYPRSRRVKPSALGGDTWLRGCPNMLKEM